MYLYMYLYMYMIYVHNYVYILHIYFRKKNEYITVNSYGDRLIKTLLFQIESQNIRGQNSTDEFFFLAECHIYVVF